MLTQYGACMDLIVSSQKTALVQAMEDLKKTVVPGYKMAVYQGIAQLKLYTSMDAPEQIIEATIQTYFTEPNL